MRLAIIGGASRVGMALRRRFAGRDGIEIIALVRKPVAAVGTETVKVVEDYFTPDLSVLTTCDAIVNCAGRTDGRSDADFAEVNVAGPIRLAQAAKKAGSRHFVHISSLSIYGRAQTIGASTPEAPINPYGRSKCAGDRGLAGLASEHFAVALLRVPIIYGPGKTSKLHLLAGAMRRLGWFPVPGALPQRSIIHVENVAGAIETVLKERLNGVCFAADPELFTAHAMAEAIGGVRLVRFPDPFFGLLRRCTPSLYASLFGNSVIAQDQCVLLPEHGTLLLSQALRDVI